MKIGIEVTSAVRQGGGIGRYTRELLKGLAQHDGAHRFRLFAASTMPIPHPLPALPGNFSFRRLPIHDKWLARLWGRIDVPIPVETILGPVDLYHSPDFTLPPTLPGTPALLTVHDLTFERDPASAAPGLLGYLRKVVPRSIRRAEHVLADSEATRSDILELYGTAPEKVRVLYPGVGPEFCPIRDARVLAAVRAKYGLGEDSFVLAVSTIQPRKNYVRLIQAFAQLRHPRLSLVIVGGTGWMYDSIFAEVERLGLGGRVLFPGFADERDLPALYSAARALAYPSLYEGFGLPMLEAMRCGTPVVASTASCLPEVAGNAALLVDPLDVDAIAGALARAIEDGPARQRLISAGFARAREFTWDRAARQLLEMYERAGNT